MYTHVNARGCQFRGPIGLLQTIPDKIRVFGQTDWEREANKIILKIMQATGVTFSKDLLVGAISGVGGTKRILPQRGACYFSR